MKRRAIHIESSLHDTIRIYIDQENAASILQYVFRKTVDEEFREIRELVKNSLRNKEKYCKVAVSDKAKNVFEMRFTRNQRNDRIYCSEKTIGKRRYIIMIELYEGKKSQSIPQKIKNRIQTMGTYEYEY